MKRLRLRCERRWELREWTGRTPTAFDRGVSCSGGTHTGSRDFRSNTSPASLKAADLAVRSRNPAYPREPGSPGVSSRTLDRKGAQPTGRRHIPGTMEPAPGMQPFAGTPRPSPHH